MSLTSSSAADDRFQEHFATETSEAAPEALRHATYFRWKIILDVGIAALLLVPVGVAIAFLVLLVRATSRGPGIFRQIRVGKNGRRFMMYKIRTMSVDAESATGPVWAQPHDRRVTFVGRILRKMHLDELPQIFNVLRGEMSFVGPRPERPEFVSVLSEAIPRYRERNLVRPGITGIAQINLPPDTDLLSVRRKLVFDLDYIEHGDFWLDVRLLLCTAFRIIKVNEGFLTHMLGLQRAELLAEVDASAKSGEEPQEATPEAILLRAAQATSANAAHIEDSKIGLSRATSKPR